MRGLDTHDGTSQAIEREKARRFFESLDGDELEAAIDRFNGDMSAVALNELISRITSNPCEQEACLRRVKQGERKLAGPKASPLVRVLARSVVILRIEKYLADKKFYELIETLGCESMGSLTRDILRWRDFADRQLHAKIRTLAYVRHIDQSSIEQTIDQLRIAS